MIASLLLAAEGSERTAPGWLWALTLSLAPLLIAFDLYVVDKIHPRLTHRAAFAWTAIWFLFGLLFAIPIASAAGEAYGVKYATGYLVEKGLTIDQVFVIAIIIDTWRVPTTLARRLVFLALWIGLLMHIPSIALGYLLAESDSIVLRLVMSGFFVFGGIGLLRTRGEHANPASLPVVKLLGRLRPVEPAYEGRQLTVDRGGVRFFTLAAVVLTALLTADLYFAATVPLAFAFTKPPYIVLASTTFALFGVRSMYSFVYAIRMDVSKLKVALALALWLVAIDLAISSYLDRPSWLIPVFVFVVVSLPILWGYRSTAPDERARRAGEAIPAAEA